MTGELSSTLRRGQAPYLLSGDTPVLLAVERISPATYRPYHQTPRAQISHAVLDGVLHGVTWPSLTNKDTLTWTEFSGAFSMFGMAMLSQWISSFKKSIWDTAAMGTCACVRMVKSVSNVVGKDVCAPPRRRDAGKELKAAFSLLDQNKDGRINAHELKLMLSNLGIMFTDAMIDALILQASGREDGLISEEEFLAWMAAQTSIDDDVMEDLLAAFRVFDKDSNGYITRDELKLAMEMIGERVSDQELDGMLRATDTDNDGRINYEEFVTVLL